MTSSYNELSFPQPTSASVLSCVRSLTATFGSRLFASSLTDSSLFDCRALAQNGSYRKKNLHHYSEELTLQSEGNCGWFRTCCTFKETAPLRFLVYLTGALISGCFCTCPLNLSGASSHAHYCRTERMSFSNDPTALSLPTTGYCSAARQE